MTPGMHAIKVVSAREYGVIIGAAKRATIRRTNLARTLGSDSEAAKQAWTAEEMAWARVWKHRTLKPTESKP